MRLLSVASVPGEPASASSSSAAGSPSMNSRTIALLASSVGAGGGSGSCSCAAEGAEAPSGARRGSGGARASLWAPQVYDSTFSRTVRRLYAGAKGPVVCYRRSWVSGLARLSSGLQRLDEGLLLIIPPAF